MENKISKTVYHNNKKYEVSTMETPDFGYETLIFDYYFFGVNGTNGIDFGGLYEKRHKNMEDAINFHVLATHNIADYI